MLINSEYEFLLEEGIKLDNTLKKNNAAMEDIQKKIQNLEMEHSSCSEELMQHVNECEFSTKQKGQLKKELEVATDCIKKQEENT